MGPGSRWAEIKYLSNIDAANREFSWLTYLASSTQRGVIGKDKRLHRARFVVGTRSTVPRGVWQSVRPAGGESAIGLP